MPEPASTRNPPARICAVTGRTAAMEALVADARSGAEVGRAARRELLVELFNRGGPGERIYALGMMQGDHSLLSPAVILDGVSHSRSAFEQYHALLLARDAWDMLDANTREQVLDAIRTQMKPGAWIKHQTERLGLAEQILARAGRSPG
jgi:hypothetical protein